MAKKTRRYNEDLFVGKPTRTKHIVNWVAESITVDGNSRLLNEIEILISSPIPRDRDKGVQLFRNLILNLGDETLMRYPIRKSIREFGLPRVLSTLMTGLFGRAPRIKTIEQSAKRLTQKQLKEVKKEVVMIKKERKKFIFGYTQEGKRRKVEKVLFIRQPKVKIAYTRKDGKQISFTRKEYSYTLFQSKQGLFLRKKK